MPTGTMKVGYQSQCAPKGLMAAFMSDKGVVDTVIAEKDFVGTDPTLTISNVHVSMSCVGQVTVRSYAVLTRSSDGADSVVSYYGVYTPL